jgi:hypothetical protein
MQIRKTAKRGLLLVITVVAAVLIFVVFKNYRAGQRMHAALSAVQQSGEPLTLADLGRDAVPSDENAAAVLARLHADLIAIQDEFRPLHDGPAADQYYDQEVLTQAGHALISAAFEHYPNLSDQLMRAAEIPEYASQADFNLPVQQFLEAQLTRVQFLRVPARTLDHRAQMLLFEGKQEEAARCGVAVLQLARHFDREPLLISYLVALAVRSQGLSILERSLAAGPLSEEMRQSIDRELARHDAMPGLKLSLLSERTLGIAQFRELFGGLSRSMWWTRDDLSDYLDILATHLKIGAQPKYVVAAQLQELDQRLLTAGTLTQLTAPALQATNHQCRASAGRQAIRSASESCRLGSSRRDENRSLRRQSTATDPDPGWLDRLRDWKEWKG